LIEEISLIDSSKAECRFKISDISELLVLDGFNSSNVFYFLTNFILVTIYLQTL
jgi:hypothetical protein